ncbi:diguanylate cyclase, partial [Aquicoccus sp. SCR17]|nr:diguanylate cyclase [Carideicomes alvinocaridis]
EEAPAFATPARVALACHRPGEAAGWAEALHGSGLAATVLSPRALLSAPGSGWDAVVIGLSPDLPENGLPLFSELRSRRTLRHARLIAVVPGPDAADPAAPGPGPAELAARALDLSADAVLSAPVDPEELQLRLAAQIRRKRVADRLRDQWREGMQAAITDPLTGLYNRRYALPYLARALDMSRRAGRDCAVMLADLDHFKRVNDRWGHAAGDAVLQAVAHRLRDNLRAGDMVARLGGEEFLVVMPDTPRFEARNAARRICRLVRDPPVSLPGGAGAATVTVSIGLAGRFNVPGAQEAAAEQAGAPDGEGETLEQAQCLLAEADRALYRAKARGRDRVRECPDAP